MVRAVEADQKSWGTLVRMLTEGSFMDAKRIVVDGDHAPICS
jgi:hypothetical protein